VKGFALTLVIGLVANVFTAVFVSKTIFDWELSRGRQVTALSI
jgi:preprotein translocase subunit SecD